jgi:hypothetical protein
MLPLSSEVGDPYATVPLWTMQSMNLTSFFITSNYMPGTGVWLLVLNFQMLHFGPLWRASSTAPARALPNCIFFSSSKVQAPETTLTGAVFAQLEPQNTRPAPGLPLALLPALFHQTWNKLQPLPPKKQAAETPDQTRGLPPPRLSLLSRRNLAATAGWIPSVGLPGWRAERLLWAAKSTNPLWRKTIWVTETAEASPTGRRAPSGWGD